jgi:hypothetical protein
MEKRLWEEMEYRILVPHIRAGELQALNQSTQSVAHKSAVVLQHEGRGAITAAAKRKAASGHGSKGSSGLATLR